MAAARSPPLDRRMLLACLAVSAGAMLMAAAVNIRWGAFAVGGSDSHCYAGQARMFVEGRVSLAPPLARPVPWPNAAATFAPSGFAPRPDPAGGSVPLCAARLALAMAAVMRLAGDAAIFAVVPVLGVLAVWSTWLLGRRLAGPVVGAASALLVACSPIFLYQLVRPMSDVPAAALWTAALATALGPSASGRPGVAWVLLAFAAGVLAAYLPYVPFTDGWYARFMLPAMPALIVLMMTLLERTAGRLPTSAGLAALVVATAALGGSWMMRADTLAVFQLKTLEQKYVELGRLASSRLPRNAVVVAAQPAGSVRHYARLPTLSWDAIEPAWLERVFAECRARGLAPYLAIEAWEMEAFKSRFRGHSDAAGLDWPPRATLGNVIFVYDVADRDRYLAGERIQTEFVTWGRR